jgi:HEAT repeat protein
VDDRDPGVRAAAAWRLGRTADLDVVPALIAALRDPDEGVVSEARTGLQVISRKLDGYGPPPGASPGQREEAANRWRAWYDSVRPPDLDGPDAALN